MGTKNSRSGLQFNPKGVTQGNTLVCPTTGNPIDTIVDNDGITRLAVDSSISLVAPPISVELDFKEDSVSIGDSVSCFKLKVEADGSINTNGASDASDGDNIAISSHPNQVFDADTGSITTAAVAEIFTFTSSDDDTKIMIMECVSETATLFTVKINGTAIRSRRSSSTQKNVEFVFREHRSLASGDVMTVDAEAEVFIANKAPYETFASLEGYIA